MGGYKPLYIKGYEKGLVQDRVDTILPNDAFPVLTNAFVFRERIKKKQGKKLVGRLKRTVTTNPVATSPGLFLYDINLLTAIKASGEPSASLSLVGGEIEIVLQVGTPDETRFISNGTTHLVKVSGPLTPDDTLIFNTGLIRFTFSSTPSPPLAGNEATFQYYPSLPVMGIRTRELDSINDEETICFDTRYAYKYVSSWGEFIPGTTWTGSNSNFFWSTNYWTSANRKLFWVTNFSGRTGDPIRYTDGITWTDFAPQIDSAVNRLTQCLCLIPFRGRLISFNTLEGTSLLTSVNYPNRIRWAAIGNPLDADAWRDDIPGKGGFLDIPISQDIISVGFVRDNVVIYCERSTWQLRYTGRSIAPFQVEKINSELGAESTFSAVQFDTSLVGIGDKGIVKCDSFSSSLIDIKIPDLVFTFNNSSDGTKRVHGWRDFIQRIAYWLYSNPAESKYSTTFPNRRLIYNYENDSWAIFTDSLTALGSFQPSESLSWAQSTYRWETQNFKWIIRLTKEPLNIGGNQKGYIHYLDYQVTNDVSLPIDGNDSIAIICRDHNLETGDFVRLKGVVGPITQDYNDQVFKVQVINTDKLYLLGYDSYSNEFNWNAPAPNFALTPPYWYGELEVVDNFLIQSKKFNFFEEGENIQLGYMDVLVNSTTSGEITLRVYNNFCDSLSVNTLPQNIDPSTNNPDTFFNAVLTTSADNSNISDSSKLWKRIFCATRASSIFLEWTFSNAQIAGAAAQQQVEITSQILWIRKAGKQLPIGI